MLPNLPALVGDWDCREFTVTANLFSFVSAVGADASRWTISFDDSLGGGMLVTTVPQEPPLNGFIVPASGSRDFYYKDYGPTVGYEWYFWPRGGAGDVHIYVASIRLRRYSEPRLRRLQREIIETLPDLKPFLTDLLNRQQPEGGG